MAEAKVQSLSLGRWFALAQEKGSSTHSFVYPTICTVIHYFGQCNAIVARHCCFDGVWINVKMYRLDGFDSAPHGSYSFCPKKTPSFHKSPVWQKANTTCRLQQHANTWTSPQDFISINFREGCAPVLHVGRLKMLFVAMLKCLGSSLP